MSELNLKCTARKGAGKNEAGRLRRSGMIPVNLIFQGKAQGLAVQAVDFKKILKNGLRQSSIFNLEIEGGEAENKVFVKELQRHPVSGEVIHADFFRVTPGKKVLVSVGVETRGMARGVKAGGAMEHFIRSLKIKATPESLQDVIEVDVSNLDVGGSIYLKDLGLPQEWEVLMEGNPIILKIARSRLTKSDDAGRREDAKDEPQA